MPLTPLAVLHPLVGGGLLYAWIEDGHFNPRRVAGGAEVALEPPIIVRELEMNRVVRPALDPFDRGLPSQDTTLTQVAAAPAPDVGGDTLTDLQ